MLDSLFGDNSANDIYDSKKRSSRELSNSVKSAPRFLEREGGTGLVGITNQGATCYLNSLIQTLFFTPELRDAVFKLRENEIGKLGTRDARPIPLQLQMLFANMLLLDQASVVTSDLTDSFGWNNSDEGFSQHDVQELNRILFTALEDSLVGLTVSELVNNLYRGTVVNQIRCMKCGAVSEREEAYLDLTLAVSGYSSISDSLTESYLCTETLSGKNQYKCEKCDELVDAEKGAKLRELPPILTFCLLRLTFDFQKMERKKDTSTYTFPEKISMGAYMDTDSSKCTDYELFSVVVHRGGAHGGHYHALIKDIDGLGHWTIPDEKPQSTDKVTSKKTPDDLLQFEYPTELLDHILSKESNWITIDQLTQKIQHETGVSWNKQFKKRHGAIARFLSSNSDRYLFDEASRKVISSAVLVSLADSGDSATADKDEQDHTEQPVESEDQWFGFDDRRVRPVRKSDIERYYGGKECAYMLYYRQSSLIRPPEAKGNTRYLIPQHIIESIEEDNKQLRAQREAEEVSLNTVKIKVYFPTKYTFQDSRITAKSGHVFTEVQFDQRKNISDLIVSLYAELADEEIVSDQEDNTLFIVKPFYNVLHLLENLSDDQPQHTSVASLRLGSDSGLLLLSKSLIDKYEVLCGSSHEPYQVTFHYGDRNPTVLLAKSLSMQELPAHVMRLFQIDPPLYLYVAENFSTAQTELPTNESESLYKYVSDGAILVVSHSANVAATPSGIVNLYIEGRLHNANIARYSVTVRLNDSTSSLIQQIKSQAISKYDLPPSLTLRLRPLQNDTPGVPLYSDRTMRECGVSNGTVLMVEEGEAVSASNMIIYYTVSHSITYSIVCKCTQSIERCVEQMVETASPLASSSSMYYLMTVDWVGEPHEVLYNTSQSLAKARIKHGDSLILVEGIPPPKDAITVNVLWQMVSDIKHQTYEQWLINSMEDLHLVSENQDDVEYLSVEVTVGRDDTIEELKTKLLSIIPDIGISSISCMRLRALSGKNPGSIYKTSKKTLKSYKLRGPRLTMLMEVLPAEEHMNEDEFLLTLRRKDMDAGSYCLEEPFLWKASDGATARQLRLELATHLSCGLTELHIAKYITEQREWKVIKKSAPSNTQRGKRGAKGKSSEPSLRKAPYMLQDGDLIGYIISQSAPDEKSEPVKAETFETDQDRKFKQKQADEKRQQRLKSKEDNESWGVISPSQDGKTKEKAIRISVGTFTKKEEDL